MEKKFFIEGMSCANCALSIEKNLNNKKGIASVNVSKGSSVNANDVIASIN